MNDLILIGSGGHCRSVIDVIEQEDKFKIAGLVDKLNSKVDNISGYPVIGYDRDLKNLVSKYKYAFIAVGQIGSSELRIDLFKMAKKLGFIMPSIISPRSYISRNSTIGEGTIIMHDALINSNVRIGKNCIINSKALIEHDSEIKSHCHISTNTTINGNVIVGEGSFVGSGSTTKENTRIDAKSFIKAGSIVK